MNTFTLPAKAAVKVCVTGGAGSVGTYLCHFIAEGAMLGRDQPIELRILELSKEKSEGVLMELNDCAYPLLVSVIGTENEKDAFTDVDIAILVGAQPRSPGMDRADLLKANAAIFEAQGKALDQYASRKVKVLVVGNPCNTNALIACKNAPSLSSACFAAMARLDENRAKSVLARKTGQRAGTIKNVCIFGNHSKTLVVDADHAYISTGDSRHHQSVRSAVADDAFLDSDLITEVQLRGSVILGARGVSSAPSAAKAAVDTMRDWVMGTPEGEWSNMAVPTDGSAYGVPEGLVCAFPLACKNGEYSVVKGLRLSGGTREKLKVSIDELVNERAAAGGQEEKDADK